MGTMGGTEHAVRHDIYDRAFSLRRTAGDAVVRVAVSARGSAVLAMARHLAELRYGVAPAVTELVRRAVECHAVSEGRPLPPVPDVGKATRKGTTHSGVPVLADALDLCTVTGSGIPARVANPWVAALACHMSPDTIRLWPMDKRVQAIYCVPDPKQYPQPVSPGLIRWTLDRGRVLGLAERDLRDNDPEPLPEVAEWWSQSRPIIEAATRRAAAWFGW